MRPADLAAILTAGRPLEALEADMLAEALLPPSALRARRLDARDEALRQVSALQGDSGTYLAACSLERAINGFLAGSFWRAHSDADQPPIGAAALEVLLHRACRSNGGRGLSLSQCINVLRGSRTPSC